MTNNYSWPTVMCDESEQQISNLQINEDGRGNLSFPSDTNPRILDLTKTKLGQSKDAVEIFWSYPMGVLTLIIATGYTQERQPYSIAFDVESMGDNVKRVYQVRNSEDIEIKLDSEKIILESDCSGQVIAKLQSWPEMTTYGTYIRYQIIRK